MSDKLILKYPPNWTKDFCKWVNTLKTEIQIALIRYGRIGKI